MDYEYDGEEPYETRVMWGRIAVYAVSLILAFLLGSCVGGDGASDAEVTELREQVADLAERNEVLEQQIAAVGASNAERPRISPTDEPTDSAEDGTGAPEGDGEGTESPAAEDETRTYTVEPGDTLTAIAQKMYGDSTKFDLIAEANDLESQLVVGQELIIPPAN